MSPTGKEQPIPDHTSSVSGRMVWGCGLALLLYALTFYANETLGVAGVALSYPLACFACMALVAVSWRGKPAGLILVLIPATVVGYVLARQFGFEYWAATWLAMIVPPLGAGMTLRAGRSPCTAFVVGLVLLMGIIVAHRWSIWPVLMSYYRETADEIVQSVFARVSPGGVDMATRETWSERIRMVAGFLPAFALMSAITQYSIGTTWLLHRTDRLAPFTQWRMPRSVAVVAVVSAVMAWGSGNVHIFGANALFVLGLFYCVTGIATMECWLAQVQARWWLRLPVYVILLVTHLYGLALLALIGFVDSLVSLCKDRVGEVMKESVS